MATERQSYIAMFLFLENFYKMTKSDDIGALLGSLRLLRHGGPADPAFQKDWHEAYLNALDVQVIGEDWG